MCIKIEGLKLCSYEILRHCALYLKSLSHSYYCCIIHKHLLVNLNLSEGSFLKFWISFFYIAFYNISYFLLLNNPLFCFSSKWKSELR